MVDLHCEATSEKRGVGFFCDGRASLAGWVERQRYPSNSFRDVDGFREGLNPSYGLRATGSAPMIATMISEKTLSQRIIQELL